jgi:GDSL-like Lipase/Acylhydrolase
LCFVQALDRVSIVKKVIQIGTFIFLLGLAAFPVEAGFTSLYIFGDGLSTTTDNTSGLDYYYGKRYTNGRIWVEVMAQRLGLGANSLTNANWSNATNDWSYYGQYSFNLMTNVNHFPPPQDGPTALFMVWVNNADFVNDMGTIYPSTNSTTWNNAITNSLNNHWSIINNLYAKGARTIIMPNAVDITEIPVYAGLKYSHPGIRNFIRQEIIYFNNQYAGLLNQARASLPGLTIYEPDYFGLLDNVLTNASAYGLTNALYNGASTYAVASQNPNSFTNVNGPGTNYIFWDQMDPTAKLHEIMAEQAVQMVAPVYFSQIAVLSSSTAPTCTNRLDIINMPVGLNGFVDGTTNTGLINLTWTTVTNISSTSTIQSVFVNAAWVPPIIPTSGYGSINPGNSGTSSNGTDSSGGSLTNSPGVIQAYRLRFPSAWNWP